MISANKQSTTGQSLGFGSIAMLGTFGSESSVNVATVLDTVDEIALLADVSSYANYTVVAASQGFFKATGHTANEVLGQSLSSLTTRAAGLPKACVSKSAGKDLDDFCNTCSRTDVDFIAESAAIIPGVRANGSFFQSLCMFGRCLVRGRPHVLTVHRLVGEGLFGHVLPAQCEVAKEDARRSLQQLRSHISRHWEIGSGKVNEARTRKEGITKQRYGRGNVSCRGIEGTDRLHSAREHVPDFAFFVERLQHHCILKDAAHTAERREAQEIPSGCLVFSDRPLEVTAAGLRFCLRINRVTRTFVGLPTLGFTRRKPLDEQDLCPSSPKCLGRSVLVGAMGEASARDKHEHFKIGFRPPPQEEVQTWSTAEMETGMGKKRASDGQKLALREGDLVACVYTHDGQMQLWRNSDLILDVDVGRPIESDSDYYAVVDVSFAACSVTVEPWHVFDDMKMTGVAQSEHSHLRHDSKTSVGLDWSSSGSTAEPHSRQASRDSQESQEWQDVASDLATYVEVDTNAHKPFRNEIAIVPYIASAVGMLAMLTIAKVWHQK